MSEGGVSAAYVDSRIAAEVSALRSEMLAEVRGLERELNRLEQEMAELARAVVAAIESQTHEIASQLKIQTAAVVGGIATTTLMLERTKDQLEVEFKETRGKLDLQTETGLQVEVGKKVADAAAGKSKLDAFRRDINERFDKSLELIHQNRLLYNTHFKKIFEEYEHKLKTIGDHIFELRDVDLAPAEAAARVPPEELHGLPMEVDLYRLKVRSENLDESLGLLKSTRLDSILTSTQTLDSTIRTGYAVDVKGKVSDAALVGVCIQSKLGDNLFVGMMANQVKDAPVSLLASGTDLDSYGSEVSLERAGAALNSRKSRVLTNEELVSLAKAADRVRQKGLVSQEALVMFEDFLGQGTLRYTE